jgi:nucleotide-binding universal stress UspA family protein
MKFQDILVPVDFSPNSLRALDFAVSLVDSGGEIYLLHVIDSDFIERLSEAGFGEPENAMATLRAKAEMRLQEVISGLSQSGAHLDSMVVVGKPFSEILRVAVDLDFQAIVLGIHGRASAGIEELLFGSTAEKVLRGARIPVICVPASLAG